MVSYIGTRDIGRLVRDTGLARFISALSEAIAADYRRWDEFQNTARTHSKLGVIELMPTTDGPSWGVER